MNKQQALAMMESRWWEGMDDRDVATVQMNIPERRLCMPFHRFQETMERVLGRPVMTHEFAYDWDGLKAELLGDRPAPTIEQVIDLIPADKRLLVAVGEHGD